MNFKIKQHFLDSPFTFNKTCDNKLIANSCMERGDELCSKNGVYKLRFVQNNGNLMINEQKNFTTKWSKKIDNMEAVAVCLNSDGNLIIYDGKNYKIWTSKSSKQNTTDVFAVLEDDGSFVIYDIKEKLWSSGLFFIRT